MNSVDRILNFINSQPDNNISTIEPKVEQEDITPKPIDNNNEPSIESPWYAGARNNTFSRLDEP